MSKFLIIACGCVVALFSIASIATGGNSVLLEKPYFTIYLESINTRANIGFNRQLISMENGQPTEVELPVNHLIKAGENELTILLIANDKKNKIYLENSQVKMTLRVRPSGSDPSHNFTLATLEFSGERLIKGNVLKGNVPANTLNSRMNFVQDPDGDVAISEVSIKDFRNIGDVITRTVVLPAIGLPHWAFFDSDIITNIKGVDIDGEIDENLDEELINEMLPIYSAIWNALQTKNIEPILPLFDERNREYDAAFYRKPGTTARILAENLKESATNPEKILFPITSTNTMSQVYDNDKLARLRMNNRDPLIAFNFVRGGSEYYDIILRKKNGKWIITR
jgi:hypothetical protein